MNRRAVFPYLSLAVAILVVTAAAALLASACGGDGGDGAASAIPAGKRVININAIEPKGSTTVDKEPFPEGELPNGYAVKPPSEEGEWEVEVYMWSPATVVVRQGDEVELNFFGVNSSEHDTEVEGYTEHFTVSRGQLTTITFTADQAGIFPIICYTHAPAMTGQLVVLPN